MSAAWTAAGRIGAVLCASLLLIAPQLEPAAAASRVCRQLEAELAAARGGIKQGLHRKYDRAVAAQAEQIAIARRQARAAGCGFRILGTSAACNALDDRIGRMESNLSTLRRKRAQLAPGAPRRTRLRILAELDANGCRRPRPMARSAPPSEEGPDENTAPPDANEGTDSVAAGPEGEFRTVCVRTCDGYFFPMSNASRWSDFQRDQKNCEAACPGAEMRLYRQGAGAEGMMSTVTGEAYTALPNAFLYKVEGMPRPAGCGCGAANDPSTTAGGPAAAAEKTGGSIITLGTESPPESEEKEPAVPVQSTPAAPPQAEARPMDDRKVRVVGPTFLPAPEAAIDLRAPAPRQAR
ncbi:DUF2865 domain-containing protein [Mesorhizobium sp. L-8-3]|uniref:DUF2865 domain-containing protein n=1 Tax=Mesorhizobium sp. L-8-3 TaxID=2744522 RepID=UPI00192846CF|nr:DUF2865 domain-containing protein [Mesorhizobium sp. L-8-3]